MKMYTVHIKKDAENPLESAIFVREGGFSIAAGIFQMFWALYNKMWFCAALLFLAQACLVAIETQGVLSENASLVLRMGFFALLGFSANDWYQSHLANSGYILKDVVCASDETEAQAKFLGRYLGHNEITLA